MIFKDSGDLEDQKTQESVPMVIELPPQQLKIVSMESPVKEGNIIRRFVISNMTDQIVFLNLHLYAKAQIPVNLFRVPNVISSCVKPNSCLQIFAMVKIIAEQEWEELNYEINLQYMENKQAQQYGGYDNKYKEDDYGHKNIPNAPKLNLKLENAGNMDVEYGPYANTGYSTLKSCKHCSTLNDVYNPKCRECAKDM